MLECSRVSHKSAIIKPDVLLIEYEITKRVYYVTTNQGQEMLKPDTILEIHPPGGIRGLSHPH
jgi:hypothetical protein